LAPKTVHISVKQVKSVDLTNGGGMVMNTESSGLMVRLAL
jgi:hypothetical protein